MQANVNLATEVALVKVLLPGDVGNQQSRDAGLKLLTEELLASLESSGFRSKVRDPKQGNAAAAAVVKARREERLR